MKSVMSLAEIEHAIAKAKPEQQTRLLRDLPHLLKLSPANLALLKLAEPAFEFWQNPDDRMYDQL